MTGPGYDPVIQGERIALVDLLDRVLGGGVVIVGDITLSIAEWIWSGCHCARW